MRGSWIVAIRVILLIKVLLTKKGFLLSFEVLNRMTLEIVLICQSSPTFSCVLGVISIGVATAALVFSFVCLYKICKKQG